MDEINTEKPLSFDYFYQNETMDTETVRSLLREYQEIGGLSVLYYKQQDPNLFMDTVFLEKADKKWCKPIRIKAVFQYLEEVIENKRAGIEIIDELNITTEKKYFLENIKSEPKIGDVIFIESVGLYFDCVNVIDSDSNFFGNKLTWKITGKVWEESHEDKELSDDVIQPGFGSNDDGSWEPDKAGFEQNEKIEDDADDLHTYVPGDDPFGNY